MIPDSNRIVVVKTPADRRASKFQLYLYSQLASATAAFFGDSLRLTRFAFCDALGLATATRSASLGLDPASLFDDRPIAPLDLNPWGRRDFHTRSLDYNPLCYCDDRAACQNSKRQSDGFHHIVHLPVSCVANASLGNPFLNPLVMPEQREQNNDWDWDTK